MISGEEAVQDLEGLVHAGTQISEWGVDLTVDQVYKVKNRGQIDFGGGERRDSKLTRIEPEPKNPEDDYGWWELEPGTYLIEYNEKLKEGKFSLLYPLKRLTRNLSTHPSKFLTEIEPIPLFVGPNGISIKENSRISRISILGI